MLHNKHNTQSPNCLFSMPQCSPWSHHQIVVPNWTLCNRWTFCAHVIRYASEPFTSGILLIEWNEAWTLHYKVDLDPNITPALKADNKQTNKQKWRPCNKDTRLFHWKFSFSFTLIIQHEQPGKVNECPGV